MKIDYSLSNKSGVYKIKNIKTGKFYIGSSCNLYNRLYEHFRYLKLNKHANPKLQSSYNKHGEDSFEYEIMMFDSCENCFKAEQFCFDTYKPEYNVYLQAEMTNRKLSEETKRKIGEKSKQKFIDNPNLKNILKEARNKKPVWNKGKKDIYSEETKKKMSDSAKNSYKNKLGKADVRKKAICSSVETNRVPVVIYNNQGELIEEFFSISEAVKILNLSKSAGANIISGLDVDKIRYGYYWKRLKK
jgi:group I intron endonuclease